MLERYRDDRRIYHIAGSNWQDGNKRGNADYYFSYIPGIWGWATWRDRWIEYKFDLFENREKWEKVNSNLNEIVFSQKEKEFQIECFNACKENRIDTWDYQWRFLTFLKMAYSIFPNKNLISNIGHGKDGTHTFNSLHWRANLKLEELIFPLVHPKRIKVNKKADLFLAKHLFLENRIMKKDQKIFEKIKKKIFSYFKNK